MGFRDTAKYGPFTLGSNGAAMPMLLSTSFRNAVFTIIASGTASYTIKFYTSIWDARPDLTISSSATNQYSVCQVVKLADGTAVDGNTGLVIAADGQYQVEINENVNTWIGAKITAYTSGSADIYVALADNQ